jgi:spore coat polysaccharide biosynthesis predicted glycosyltransferase SpsG
VTLRVVLVADASASAGLGHLSRSTAVAHALAEVGVETERLALGAPEAVTRDQLEWQALDDLGSAAAPAGAAAAIVLDGYELDRAEVTSIAGLAPLAWFDDFGDVPGDARLLVAPARLPRPEDGDRVVLTGLAHAPLGRQFWDPPRREIAPEVGRVLVTMGGTDTRDKGAEIAAATRDAAPGAEVALVRGPHAKSATPPPGVSVVGPLAGLGDQLAASGLVVGAAGQTMLEAAALGTPALVAVVAENQRAGARELERRGAAELFDLDDPDDLNARIAGLVADAERRRRMSAAAQEAVDGAGARRIARAVISLAGGGR